MGFLSCGIFNHSFRIAGDVTGLAGAVISNQLITVDIISSMYLFCDSLLLAQFFIYRNPSNNIPPASRKTTGMLAISVLTTAYFFVPQNIEYTTFQMSRIQKREVSDADLAKILGYISTLCYTFARIPQIYKNFISKSVKGLRISLFLCAILGAITYISSIMFESRMEQAYLINAMPWILGAAGATFFDFLILFQFYYYSRKARIHPEEVVPAENGKP